MAELEKVILGIENCITTDSVTECRKTECPFIACRESCLEWLLRSALSLLKAQEPRVMTLEEVKNSEVLYFEDFTDSSDGVEPIIRPAVNIEVKNGGIVMLDSVMWDDGFTFSTDEEYGKTWRCWTSRPSDSERENTPWE